ncbi:MAG: DMT family transporter, partial [Verrucomicrobiae bacterium]|nr:DMT family transporter [Verrucomicrobiae bacterium]
TVNSWFFALIFGTLLFVPVGPEVRWDWKVPVVIGTLSLIGNLLMMQALGRGDVSVAGPLMGTKVLYVAALTPVVLGEAVPLRWWVGAALSAVGVALLGGDGSHRGGHRVLTICCSLGSAMVFAVADVLVQRWVSAGAFPRVMPLAMLWAAVLSLVLVPFFRAPLHALSTRTWGYLAWGGGALGAQAMLILYTLSHHGHATAVNIAYSTRGIWSVVLVGVLGRWLATPGEQARMDRRTLCRRLAGASVVLVAVILVLV